MRATRSGVLLAALTVSAALIASPACLAQAPPATAPIPPPASSAPPSTSSPPAAVAAPAVAQPAPPRLSAQVEAAIDRRIETLRSQLGITAAQMPLWDAFAKAMRENAQGTDALFAQRAGAVATMSAVDNMHDYARIARAYADNTERLAAAFDSLYASLSETQRRAADTIFREQARPRRSSAVDPRRRLQRGRDLLVTGFAVGDHGPDDFGRKEAMAKGILIAAMDFSAAPEDEFHDWYDLEHVPERLRVPGFLNADRWIGADNPKISVATYDLDNVDVLKSPAYLPSAATTARPGPSAPLSSARVSCATKASSCFPATARRRREPRR